MREGWEVNKIGDVAKVNYGYTAKASFDDVGPKFLRITDIQNGSVDWMKVPSCPISDEDHDKHLLKEGDIVFARTGATTGKSYRITNPPDAVAASYLIRLRLRNYKIDPAFVSYFFQTASYWDAIAIGTTGSAQGGFNASKLADLELPTPTLPEQKRIVAILDEAFEGIAQATKNAEKNLANARELFKSYLNSVFTQKGEGWELVKLSDLATDITDGDHAPPPKSSSGIPFITISNIHKGSNRIDFSDTFKVPEDYFQNLKPNRRPRIGDVLYTVTGSFGIPVIVDEERDFCFQRHIGLVRPNKDVNSTWLYYLLMSPSVFRQASKGATGTAQKTVSLKVLRNIKVPRIPLSEQGKAVTVLDDLSTETQRLETIYQQKLAALAELKQSLLQKAFAGELTAEPEIAIKEEAVLQ